MPTRLLINGRFLTRPLSGVDRTATEITRALAALAGQNDLVIDCAVPRGAPDDAAIRERLGLPSSSRIHRSALAGYAWEQFALAWLEPGATLLSLCNMGPVLRRNQLVMIHDTQVRDAPDSYSLGFRIAYRLLQPPLARRVRTLVTVSQHSRRRLLANRIGHRRPIHVIPNGGDHFTQARSDPAVLMRLGLRPGGYLFALAHPSPHKNVAMLLRAFMRRRDPGLPLVLAGPGDAASLMPEGSEGTDAVRFIGRVSDSELKTLYQNARLFLFPSLTEGFGFPVLEAMSCGCPVIASTGGAIPEVAGEAAMLVDPADQSAWTHAIEALERDRTQLAVLAAAGRRQASQFTWLRSAKLLLDSLEAETAPAISRKGSPPGHPA